MSWIETRIKDGSLFPSLGSFHSQHIISVSQGFNDGFKLGNL